MPPPPPGALVAPGSRPETSPPAALTDGGPDQARRAAPPLTPRDRLSLRFPAVLAALGTLVLGMNWVIWWDPIAKHQSGFWQTPGDLWETYVNAVNLVHGHIGQVYSTQTHLVSFPGIVYLFAPLAAIGSALGLTVGAPYSVYSAPTAWVLIGPVELLMSAVALFALDACAERLGLDVARRLALAAVGALALSNVTVRWGHPEDALCIGLVLYAALAAQDRRWTKVAWLLGAAVAIQPLALLAVPVLLAGGGWRRLPRLAVAVAVPSVVLLAGPFIAAPHVTWYALVNQPNHPSVDHFTPWTSLSPSLGHGEVAGGPGRIVALLAAALGGWFIGRRRPSLAVVVWWCAVAMFLRCAFESVLDSFYIWPVLGLGLVLAARRGWAALGAASVVALGATWFSKVKWNGIWPWWLLVMGALMVMLALAYPARAAWVGTEGDGGDLDQATAGPSPSGAAGPAGRRPVPAQAAT